ncbi:MAG: hypothetical protein HOK92_00045 [Flavobacteriales bacterium]|nr:hypothetical protein [Flavobacteriales bacterium]
MKTQVLSTKTSEYSNCTIHTFSAIEQVPEEHWNSVLQGKNIYFSIPYLTALERGMKNEMSFYFSISYNSNNKPVLIAVFVLVKFVDKRRRFGDSVFKLRFPFKKKLENILSINALACGNVFSAGENGMLWTDDLDSRAAFVEMDKVNKQIIVDHKLKDIVSLNVFKDFWPDTVYAGNALIEKGYFDFKIDVNMVLNIHNEWNTMQDYLASMKTKFRTRANAVFRRSERLVVKSLNPEEIISHKDRIRFLFDNVLEKSDFHIGTMTPETFAACKKNLGDAFLFKAYFLDDLLVGFSTSFINTTSFDANYVGLDYAYNEKFDIYQRILYDYVDEAIKARVTELQFGRTSELIKSAVGALPVDMTIYIKHKRSLSNLILKNVIQSVKPSPFELRKPFKANFK